MSAEIIKNEQSGLYDLFIGGIFWGGFEQKEAAELRAETLHDLAAVKAYFDMLDGLPLPAAVEAFEMGRVRRAMLAHSNNKSRAAKALQINRTTLLGKLGNGRKS